MKQLTTYERVLSVVYFLAVLVIAYDMVMWGAA